jgi:hypothetical protein
MAVRACNDQVSAPVTGIRRNNPAWRPIEYLRRDVLLCAEKFRRPRLDQLLAFAFCILDESRRLRKLANLDGADDAESAIRRPRACSDFFKNVLRSRPRSRWRSGLSFEIFESLRV